MCILYQKKGLSMLKDTDNDQMGVFHNNDGVNRIHKKKGGVGKQDSKKGVHLTGTPNSKEFFFILVEKFYETLMVIVQ